MPVPLPLTAGEIQLKRREAVLKIRELFLAKINEAYETVNDIVDDWVSNYSGITPEDDYEDYERLTDGVRAEACREFGHSLSPQVWVLHNWHSQEIEIFSERPRTPIVDPTNSWDNWPLWYRIYEGNIDGGDSVLIEQDRVEV